VDDLRFGFDVRCVSIFAESLLPFPKIVYLTPEGVEFRSHD
jgi:hypothetical protein